MCKNQGFKISTLKYIDYCKKNKVKLTILDEEKLDKEFLKIEQDLLKKT